MICPRCGGGGMVGPCFVEHADGTGDIMPSVHCTDCLGTGEVDDHYPEWLERGRRMKAARMNPYVDMRTMAARLGVDVVTYSRMERGLCEPKEGQ